MDLVITSHIESTPGTCGGKPRIAGHRIRVQDVVMWHEAHGLSPDEIVNHYPGITLADVYAALAYYHDHRDEIRGDMEQDCVRVETFRRDCPGDVIELDAPNGRDDSLPSG